MNQTHPIWRRVLNRLHASWRSILAAHLAFTALSFIVFAPLIGLTGRLLLKFSGQPVLADQDIARFLLSPAGLLALTVFAALVIAVLAFEQATMMHLLRLDAPHKTTGLLNALLRTIAQAHRLWFFTARLIIRVLILTLPLLAIAALVAWFLISDYDINFYLSVKPPEFIIAVILIAVILIIMAALLVGKLLQWSLALPLVLFDNCSPATAFSESTRIVRGHKKTVFVLGLGWGAVSILIGLLVFACLKWLGTTIIPTVYHSLPLSVFVLGGLGAVWIALNLLITALTSGSFALLILQIYSEYAPGANKQTSLANRSVDQPDTHYLRPRNLFIALGLGALIAGLVGLHLINGIPTNNEVSIAAHRGAAGKAPENTLASIQQAIDDRTDWIEIDVQENADGDIMVIHDSDFMKLAGDPTKIWEATQGQLNDIDVGSWFDPRFSAERVPSLEQVLALAKGKAKVIIELKYYGHDQNLEQRVIDIVEGAEMVEEIAIMSLKYQAVEKMRLLRPSWSVGLLSATAIGDLTRLDTDFLAVATGMASAGFIERAHRANRKVYVWTVNDAITMSRMISLNVDGIITDEPELARQVLNERAEMNTLQRLLVHTALFFGESYSPRQYRDNSP